MKYWIAAACWLFLLGNSLHAQNKITGYEYWYDSDLAASVTGSVSPAESYNFSEIINTTGLNPGLHAFNIRFLDENALYSIPLCRFFFKFTPKISQEKDIVAYEYWWDMDYSNSITENIDPAAQFNLSQDLDLTSLPDGLHSVHFHFKDNSGAWSSTNSSFVFKKPDLSVEANHLTACQYWLDNDFENAVEVSITPSQVYNFNELIDFSGIVAGLHSFHFRCKNNADTWSSSVSRFFFKKEEENNDVVEVTHYRYWFDDDFENAVEETLNPASGGVNLVELVDMTQLWKGEHLLHFQFKDTRSRWSSATLDTIVKQPYPIAAFLASSTPYCDSTLVSLQNNSIDGDEYLWDFGDGVFSADFEPVHVYQAPGTFTIGLTVTDTLLGLDSTATADIIIAESVSYETINPVSCDSYTSPSGFYTWSISGNYSDTLVNSIGCDSIISINLTILSSTAGSLTTSACGSFVSPSGLYTWTSSGLYTDTLVNAVGCDSIVTVDLTIYNSTSAAIDETACFSYTSPSGLYTWISSGTYTDTIPNVFGCDSLISINLTISTVDTSVTNTDPVLTANAIDATYQWLDCTSMLPIPGAVNQSYTATSNGSYAVEVTQENCTDTSSCYSIVSVGLAETMFGAVFKVYPNPTSGELTIDLGATYRQLQLRIRNDQGQLISTSTKEQVKILNLKIKGTPGLYFIEVETPAGESTQIKVLKE